MEFASIQTKPGEWNSRLYKQNPPTRVKNNRANSIRHLHLEHRLNKYGFNRRIIYFYLTAGLITVTRRLSTNIGQKPRSLNAFTAAVAAF
jgi:hypothetical protein